MKYAKIVVKSNYEKRGDLVLRSYVRALKKIQESRLLDGDNAVIYGIVDDNNVFHELFTNKVIDYDDYILIDFNEIFDTKLIPTKRRELLEKVIDSVLFGSEQKLNFEVSTIKELADDRAVESWAYDHYLSRINPYQRLSEYDSCSYNDYNVFLRKLEEVKKMKKKNIVDIDEYEVRSYTPRPPVVEECEYLVFEMPKKYVKK